MSVILTGNLRFGGPKMTNLDHFITILVHFGHRPFWVGTLSKITGNFKILAKTLPTCTCTLELSSRGTVSKDDYFDYFSEP